MNDESYWYIQGWLLGHRLLSQGTTAEDAPSPLSGEWAGESIPEIFGTWECATLENTHAYEDGYWDALVGHDNREVHDEA
jgi:hypothetical protein